jgi:hypothetical protein
MPLDTKQATFFQPAAKYEPAEGIRVGIEYEEMLRRFGPPLIFITSGPPRSTLFYAGVNGGEVEVAVEAGKVTSAHISAGSKNTVALPK